MADLSNKRNFSTFSYGQYSATKDRNNDEVKPHAKMSEIEQGSRIITTGLSSQDQSSFGIHDRAYHAVETSTIPVPTRLRTLQTLAHDAKPFPRSSVSPTSSSIYIKECEAAAIASRLPSDHMSSMESALMKEHLSHLQVSTYVAIRNAVLRLWMKNPMIWVTIEEARGVAREDRHFPLCRQIWEFLMRNGYINFGCLQIPQAPPNTYERRNIIIVGAGIAGLAVARHIKALLSAFHQKLSHQYDIIVLEGRSRIGGRVYSHTLATGKNATLDRVDLGAQIVTGFSGGNPLTVLLQRQLVYPYRSLVHAKNNQIYGPDGQVIKTEQDLRVEGLFNLLLDIAARFKHNTMEAAMPELEAAALRNNQKFEKDNAQSIMQPYKCGEAADKILGVSKVVKSADRLVAVSRPTDELKRLGYHVFDDFDEEGLPDLARSNSLGLTLKNILDAICELAAVSKSDKTVLQWHWANMEYACGTNLDNLSLEHWDQDDGNEFKGHHAFVLGGYSRLARGLALAPDALCIRTNSIVQKITPTGVTTSTNQSIPAEKIVITVPLGVLKADTIQFSPQMPDCKLRAIENLGYGLLNKVVLVYEEQFWAKDIDLIGCVPTGVQEQSIAQDRGRFYMFWDCTCPTGGRPVLVALMAGDAAYECQTTLSQDLVRDATAALRSIYPGIDVPAPTEHIVTNWGQDPFSRGSYSYIGRNGTGNDYEQLAKPVSDYWYFAGEATCRTHPSTVHGAYLSGLAAAKDVVESIIGEQQISKDVPLIPTKLRPTSQNTMFTESKYRTTPSQYDAKDCQLQSGRPKQPQEARKTSKEEDLDRCIAAKLGSRPERPRRSNANPFLVFQKDQWHNCRSMADEMQQKKQNNPEARATKNQIRACLGQTWRDTKEEEKQKWIDIVNDRKKEYDVDMLRWETENARWEQACSELKTNFEEGRAKFLDGGDPEVPQEHSSTLQEKSWEISETTNEDNQGHDERVNLSQTC